MQIGNQQAAREMHAEHRKLPFERYEKQARSFRKVFGGLIGFALAFVFIMILPYHSIQAESHGVARQLASLSPPMRVTAEA